MYVCVCVCICVFVLVCVHHMSLPLPQVHPLNPRQLCRIWYNLTLSSCLIISTDSIVRASKSVISGVGALCTYTRLVPPSAVSAAMRLNLVNLSESRPKILVLVWLKGVCVCYGVCLVVYVCVTECMYVYVRLCAHTLLTHSLSTHSLTHSPTHSLSPHSLTHSLTLSLIYQSNVGSILDLGLTSSDYVEVPSQPQPSLLSTARPNTAFEAQEDFVGTYERALYLPEVIIFCCVISVLLKFIPSHLQLLYFKFFYFFFIFFSSYFIFIFFYFYFKFLYFDSYFFFFFIFFSLIVSLLFN